MHQIAEGCRHQIEISRLDCNIDTENVVRFIDAFVCKLDLVKLKFEKELLSWYFKLQKEPQIVYGHRYETDMAGKVF